MAARRASETAKDGLPILSFATRASFERWMLAAERGVWLKIAKKGSGEATIDYAEGLLAALAVGWIDGQRDRYDEVYFLQRFTPRTPRSRWSKVNRAKAESLVAKGNMHPRGHAEVAAAKADGRWDAAYDSPKNVTVHPELDEALAASPRARRFFETIDRTNRHAILYRVHAPKKAETRTRKVAEIVAMLERGEVFHPDRVPKKKRG